MEHFHFVISANSECMEGLQLHHQGAQLELHESHTLFVDPEMAQANNSLEDRLECFLSQQQWGDAYVSVVIPSEVVTFRILDFPFQNNNKIKQVLQHEVENELVGDVATMRHMHRIIPQDDGTTKVLLFLIQKSFLNTLQSVFARHNLFIKHVDFAANALSQTDPVEPSGRHFQVYLGCDEIFVTVLEDGVLANFKSIPSKIPECLHDILSPHYVDVQKLYPMTHPDVPLPLPEGTTLSQEMTDALHFIKASVVEQSHQLLEHEVAWVTRQLNLFLKTQQFSPEEHPVDVHGPLQLLIKWDEVAFRAESVETEQIQQAFPGNLKSYGILGTLQQYDLKHLEGHDLSFYSEGTPWGRFVRKNQWYLVALVTVLVILLGSSVLNWRWQQTLLQDQEVALQKQIQQSLKGVAGGGNSGKPETIIATLESQIEQKKQQLEHGTRFEKRSYAAIGFLKRISELAKKVKSEKSVTLEVERLELTKERFSISGKVTSYDGLDLLKKELLTFEEFEDREVVENNRSTPDGIQYRLSINL